MAIDIVKDVQAIKTAILKSRYVAARLANAEMLKLYFAIGGYVSRNSREGRWGTGAIDEISRLLQKELPGLRGFSATNMRYMRIFYEAWASPKIICQPLADELSLKDSKSGDFLSSRIENTICQTVSSKRNGEDVYKVSKKQQCCNLSATGWRNQRQVMLKTAR